VKADSQKIKAVKEFQRPQNNKNIKQFLAGLAGYYRRFIPNFSKIAKFLTNLLKKDKTYLVWGTRWSLRKFMKLALHGTLVTISRLYKAIPHNNRRIGLCNQWHPKLRLHRKRFTRSVYFSIIKQGGARLLYDRKGIARHNIQRTFL